MEKLRIYSGKELFVYCKNDADREIIRARKELSFILKLVTGKKACCISCEKDINVAGVCVYLGLFDDRFSVNPENERLDVHYRNPRKNIRIRGAERCLAFFRTSAAKFYRRCIAICAA